MGTRRKFTDEFKREAVKLATQPGVALTTISRELGVERSVLRRWVESTRDRLKENRHRSDNLPEPRTPKRGVAPPPNFVVL